MDDESRKALIGEIKYEDLPACYVDIVKIIGIEAFAKLCIAFGGTTFYILKFESLSAKARDRIIIKEFNGINYKELALKYNLSEVWIRNIVNKELLEKNQGSLFGEDVN